MVKLKSLILYATNPKFRFLINKLNNNVEKNNLYYFSSSRYFL